MFTDIAGYTEAMSKSEQKALEMLRRKRKIIRPLIDEHKGVYVKEIGDGTLSYFESGYDASKCAVQLQKGLKDDTELNLRVGIHIGDIVFEDDDVYGEGVNVASRLESMAPVGGVFVSNHVYDELINKEDFEGVSLGLQSLKGLGRLIEVYALIDEDLIAPNPTDYQESQVQVHSDDEVPSVAIIPFRNKGKEEEEFYAYGICSELISDVSSAGLIRVASLEKILELGELSSSEKAKRLNVRYTTTGMLWKMGDMFQLSIELYDTKDTKVIWSDQWQEDWDNLPNIKANLSTGLLKALNTENNVKTSSEIVSPEAYKYYLEAQYKFDNLKNIKEIDVIRNLLDQCLSRDKNILEADWLLARTYFHTADYQKAETLSSEIIEKGKENDNFKIVANVLGKLGEHYTFMRDFNRAIEYNQRALEISKKINDTYNIARSTCVLAWAYAEGNFKPREEISEMFESSLVIYEELEDIRQRVNTYIDLSYVHFEELEKSLEYIQLAYELAKVSDNKYDLSLVNILLGHHYQFRGEFQKADSCLLSGLEMAIEIGEKKWILLAKQILGESSYIQGKYEESLLYFEEALNITEKIDIRLWRLGAVLGVAINRKKLGLEIDYNIVKKEMKKNYNKRYIDLELSFSNLCCYLIFEDIKYLQTAYECQIKISEKLVPKDKEKFLYCPWMKMIIEEWNKLN